MDNQARAERAAKVLDAVGNTGNDVTTDIYDLICDLAHLADATLVFDGDHGGRLEADETNGEYVLRMGAWHYREELAEAEDDDE
jgi:hypothetical protein